MKLLVGETITGELLPRLKLRMREMSGKRHPAR
jgi:hypothetical protein